MRIRLIVIPALIAVAAGAFLAPAVSAAPKATEEADKVQAWYASAVDGLAAQTAGSPVLFTSGKTTYYYDGTGASRYTTAEKEGVCKAPDSTGTQVCFSHVPGAKKWLRSSSTVTVNGKPQYAASMNLFGLYLTSVSTKPDSTFTTSAVDGVTTVTVSATLKGETGPLPTTVKVTSSDGFLAMHITQINGTETIEQDVFAYTRTPKQTAIKFPPKKLVTTNLLDPGLKP